MVSQPNRNYEHCADAFLFLFVCFVMRGSRNFRQGGGGGPGQSDKKSSDNVFFFFSPQLILQKSNGQFQRNLSFFKVPEGV